MQNYQAILIHPDLKSERTSGNLSIKSTGVFFESQEINHQISLKNLSINAGGAANRFIFFSDKNQKNISIYTADKKVLKDPFLSNNEAFISEIKKSKKVLNKIWKGALITLTFFIVTIAGLYLCKDIMVEKIANKVPVSWENKVGEKLFSTLSLNYRFIKNDSLKNEFLIVAKPLFKQIEAKGYTIDLYFVKNSEINAFALPGGKVIIQTGLIENAKSWEEVLGVLSHELAHVTRRHHLRGIINNIGIFTLISVAFGDISAIAGTAANLGGELASLSNSRAFENEADETGWEYMVKAKINPAGFISFFETLKNENKKETAIDSTLSKVDLSFLSTHPNTQDRIDNLKKKQTKDTSKYESMGKNFNVFKKELLKQN
ncbi:MAG: M48 family metallopeptidase [Flavobacterium sp.]|nr:M48 family metallopeptidase [Flavobacterium sp.]